MSLLARITFTVISNEFGIDPRDEEFFPIYQQIRAIELGYTDGL